MQLQEQPTVATCAFPDTVKLRSSEHATSGPSTVGVVQSSKTCEDPYISFICYLTFVLYVINVVGFVVLRTRQSFYM